MDQVKIGAFLAALRREKNWTQEDLGGRLGVTNKTVSRWETGRYMPDIEMLSLLSREFDVSLNELIQGRRLEAEDTFRAAAEENLASALDTPLSRLRRWLERRTPWVVLVLVLALLLTAVCVLHGEYRRAHPADTALPGSFCCPDAAMPGADQIYLVFLPDRNVFYRYKQFLPLEKGTYSQNGERVVLTVDSESHEILLKDDCLYEPDENGVFLAYKKFSQLPTFINVDTAIWPAPYVP